MPEEVEVPFGSTAVLQPMIQACPDIDAVEWQKSRRMDPIAEEFDIIDVNSPKYSRSTLDPKHPKLIINETTFEDNLFFRLVVVNKVGRSNSSAFLHVTGSPPNIFMTHDTDFQHQSVTLICKVLCESSHPLRGVVWSKDNNIIDISISEGKYTGGEIDNPSLKVTNVNVSDAGIYQCCATNIVGSTLSEKVILALPNVKLLIKEKDVENRVLMLQASIKSIPDAFKVQWKAQLTPHDKFQPINLHEETYRGTTTSLPNPLLIVKNFNNSEYLKTYSVEVTNFIGIKVVTSQDVLTGEQLTEENSDELLDGANLVIFKDNGAKIRFNNLRRALIKGISEQEMTILKDTLKEMGSFDIESLNSGKSVTEFVNLLKYKKVFTDRDVISLQYLMRVIERPDLEKKCIDYATSRKERLCYFQEEKHSDGCTLVKLHVMDDIENFTKLDSLIETVAAIVECDPKFIKVVGILRENSFNIVLEVERKLAQSLLRKTGNEMLKLVEYKVDAIEIYGYKITFEKQDYDSGLQNIDVAGQSLNEVKSFLTGPCTNLFRKILRKCVVEKDFVTMIQKYKDQLLPLLTVDQLRVLYPEKGSFPGSYENLDLPLIYILFQNICSMEPHSRGWGKTPDRSDTSMAGCIENVMEIYREYFSNPSPCLKRSDFDEIIKQFDKLEEALENLKIKSFEKENERRAKEEIERRMKGERYIFRKEMEIIVNDEMKTFEERILQRPKEETFIFKMGSEIGAKEKLDRIKKGMERKAKGEMEKIAIEEMERRAKEEKNVSRKRMKKDKMDIFEEEMLQRAKEEKDVFKIGLELGAKEKTDVFKKGMQRSVQEEVYIFEKERRAKDEMEQIGKGKFLWKQFRDLSLSQHLGPSVLCTSTITVPGVKGVNYISCVTSERLWVSDHGRFLQVDNTGHVIQEMEIKEDTSFLTYLKTLPWNSPIGAHSVTGDGDLIFINGDIVQKMTLDGTITRLFRIHGLLFCIHSSRINGDILVGHRHGVKRYDLMGINCIKLGYGIRYPRAITENRNGDIWVSDIVGGEVVVMDKSGQHRFNYRGQDLFEFYPHGICSDILGHVLVCDSCHFNPSVHLLDQDGQFLRLLLTRKHGLNRPITLCVDDKHNLYVGEEDSNAIKVYKYLQETKFLKTSIMELK